MAAEIGRDISKAREILRRGLAVGIPTETVYGLAANALDADAVLQIFEIKNRPQFDPLIVHGDSRERLSKYVTVFPEWALKLADRFWPGPLTLVLPKAKSIPDLVTSGLDSVAIRVPNHPMTLDLLSQLDFPLAAPSANPFGYVSPTSAKHVMTQLGEKIPYILDGGECAVGVESTIVAEVDGRVTVLRLGGVSVEEIEALIGEVDVRTEAVPNAVMPGSLTSHYAPRTPVVIGPIEFDKYKLSMMGGLRFATEDEKLHPLQQVVLSRSGDLQEAAKNLFAGMRQMDRLGLKVIFAEEFPNVGLGRAINDRLRRAAAR